MSNRRYTPEEKGKAIALAQEIGGTEVARQLSIPEDTLYTWLAKAKKGTLETETKLPETVASDEVSRLREELKCYKKKEKADKAKMEQMGKQMKIQEDVIDFFINRQKK